jgi:transposase InsO family protein
MTDSRNDHRHAVALFRYGLIADLVRLEPGAEGLYRLIAEKAERDYVIPGTSRTRVAAETLRHWLKRYRAGGFEALLPKPRADRGRPRTIPEDLAELLTAIKAQHRELPVRAVIEQARASGQLPEEVELAPSTAHRLLAREGLMRKTTDAPSSKDRRRFAFARAGQLWMSDVMHGPSVTVEGKMRRKSYLIAFLDDATRLIPYAAFALSENTVSFLPVFKQAIVRRGIPERLYVDNGANFRSHHLALVCAKLGVALIHTRPYQPQGKGKLERWFRTVRAQLIAHLAPEDTASLEALNRRLWAYVEGEYHHAPQPRGRHPARALGQDRRAGAIPRPGRGPRRAVPVRGRATRPARSHRVPARHRLRGRRRTGRGESVASPRPRSTARAPSRGLARQPPHPRRQAPGCLCQRLRQTPPALTQPPARHPAAPAQQCIGPVPTAPRR